MRKCLVVATCPATSALEAAGAAHVSMRAQVPEDALLLIIELHCKALSLQVSVSALSCYVCR